MSLHSTRIYLALVLVLLLAVPAQGAQVVDRIVAVVNGEIITLYELKQATGVAKQRLPKGRTLTSDEEQQLQRSVLDSMIDDILLKQEAEELGISVSDAEVENQLRQFRQKHNLTDEEFVMSLKSEGISRADYEKKIRNDILKHRLIGAMVRRKVIITEEEVRKYYEERKDDYAQEHAVTLDLIVLPKDRDGAEVRESIVSGERTFAEAAKELSIGPGADAGGRLGEFAWEDLAPEWRDALDGLEVGDVSRPFDVDGRMALLHVADMSSGDAIPLSEVEDAIYRELYGPKMETLYSEYIEKLRRDAVIDTRL